jgi:hypothetical protein
MYDGDLLVCRNEESAIVDCKASALWDKIRILDFAVLFKSTVKTCFLLLPLEARSESSKITVTLNGIEYSKIPFSDNTPHTVSASQSFFTCPVAVGSLRRVEYKDGAVFTFKVTDISETNKSISFELIHTEPSIQVSAMLHTITVLGVTESGQSFVQWSTDFSGDCNYNFIQDSKFKKFDAFKDIRNVMKKSG